MSDNNLLKKRYDDIDISENVEQTYEIDNIEDALETIDFGGAFDDLDMYDY